LFILAPAIVASGTIFLFTLMFYDILLEVLLYVSKSLYFVLAISTPFRSVSNLYSSSSDSSELEAKIVFSNLLGDSKDGSFS